MVNVVSTEAVDAIAGSVIRTEMPWLSCHSYSRRHSLSYVKLTGKLSVAIAQMLDAMKSMRTINYDQIKVSFPSLECDTFGSAT
jgi:hypothetical protein